MFTLDIVHYVEPRKLLRVFFFMLLLINHHTQSHNNFNIYIFNLKLVQYIFLYISLNYNTCRASWIFKNHCIVVGVQYHLLNLYCISCFLAWCASQNQKKQICGWLPILLYMIVDIDDSLPALHVDYIRGALQLDGRIKHHMC